MKNSLLNIILKDVSFTFKKFRWILKFLIWFEFINKLLTSYLLNKWLIKLPCSTLWEINLIRRDFGELFAGWTAVD